MSRLRNVVEEAVLADKLGLDFSIGVASSSIIETTLRSLHQRSFWEQSPVERN